MRQHVNLAFPLFDEETATSYASRLARKVRAATPFDLCWDLGLSWQGIVRGDADQLRMLAKFGGIDAALLDRWAIKSRGHLTFKIGHDNVPNKTLLRSRPRVCPLCIQEDRAEGDPLGAYRRLHWNLISIRTCAKHNVPLLKLPHHEHTFGNYDFPARLDASEAEINEANSKPEHQAFSDYEAYLLRRLRGRPNNLSFADGMSLGTLTRFTETLGLALCGYTGYLKHVDETSLHQAGISAFPYIQRGHTGLIEAMHKLQIDPLKSNACHKIDFGPFHRWLSYATPTKEIENLRHIVRSHAFKNYPIQKGTVIYGQACPRTEIYSINSAKCEHGISRMRLTRSLVDLGIATLNEDKVESVTLKRRITADDIAKILSSRDNLVSRWDASAYLGTTDKAFRQLRLRGDIRQHKGEFDNRPGFDLGEIEAFLDQIFKAIKKHIKAIPQDHLRLPATCTKLGTPLVDAADMIRNGKVKSVALLPDGQGLERIVVDPEELRTAIIADMIPAVPKLKAAKLLRTSLRLIDHLIDIDHLELKKRGKHLKGHDFPAVTQESIDSFLKKYTTVGRLAHGAGQSFMYLMHHLPSSGVDSVPVPKNTGLYYERRHLKERVPFMKFKYRDELDWDTV